ncbi:PhzF family phenazine biosynthesis protein [Janthinobacterium sp.]|uniref:PhzF family phenazine biosynthesis protein n=1 Tax=Janthinobacterium sp. TaxID=1871054 RepID=UPI00293D66B1|nr:PhzF family phenazine biosynthesis protein [Janthinobacterium sp.]
MSTIQELLCFGALPGGGNPALVIEGDNSDAAARLAFARQRRSTCVFIAPGDDADADAAFTLDYFYPHMRSPLCLHATLAAAHLLFSRAPHTARIRVRSAVRGQALDLLNTADGLFIGLAAQDGAPPAIDAGLPGALLGEPGIALASAPAVASVGSPKLLLQVADGAALRALRPNLELIAAWGRAHGVSGCYAYCARPDGAYEGRNFNHLDPALEDSATGVAAGALALHLGRDLRLYQGHWLGQACLIQARLREGRVLVGGAVTPGGVVHPS